MFSLKAILQSPHIPCHKLIIRFMQIDTTQKLVKMLHIISHRLITLQVQLVELLVECLRIVQGQKLLIQLQLQLSPSIDSWNSPSITTSLVLLPPYKSMSLQLGSHKLHISFISKILSLKKSLQRCYPITTLIRIELPFKILNINLNASIRIF